MWSCCSLSWSAEFERWQEPSSKRRKLDPDHRPEATLLLESAEQEAAAVAVLAALYGVSTPPEQLQDTQLLQMVLLADMLQVDPIAGHAAKALAACAVTPGMGLCNAVEQQLLSLASWPACLVHKLSVLTQKMQLQDAAAVWARSAAPSSPSSLEAVLACQHSNHMLARLVQELGALDQQWAQEKQQAVLLGLPLPAMQLLLSSSEVQVCGHGVLMRQPATVLNLVTVAVTVLCLGWGVGAYTVPALNRKLSLVADAVLSCVAHHGTK